MLGDSPNGLYVDETSIGYNAYSILKTGKDEFGKSFPIVFRSFNDFKTPIYIYMSLPFVKSFDLTPFSIRLLSAIASFLTIPLLYLLITKLLKFNKLLTTNNPYFALIASFVLAISPWHTMFGRAAFETNLALFLFLLATYLFYISLNKPKFLIFSALIFALTIISYHSQRLITPLFVLILFVRHRQKLLSKPFRNPLIISFMIGVTILLPTLAIIFTPGLSARATGLNIFNYNSQLPAGYIQNVSGMVGQIVNIPIFLSTREFLALYLSYFSPRNLFFLGDPDVRTSYPGLATFFIWQFPFYLIGIYSLIITKKSEFKFFLMAMLILSPLPASLTRDPFSTIRALTIVIPMTMIISMGISKVIFFFQKYFSKNWLGFLANSLLVGCFMVISSYSLLKLYSSVIILNNYYRSDEWNYGFQELSVNLKSLDNNIPIVFDNVRVEPYSELLFYLKFDPNKYQQDNFEVNSQEYYSNLNRIKHKVIGNIETRGINWEEDTKTEKYLIGDSLAISDDQIKNNKLTLINKILYPDTSVAFIITKTNP